MIRPNNEPLPGGTTTRDHKVMVDADNRPVTIMLVDDDPDCRLLIRDAIANCNVSNIIIEVSNGQEALDVLEGKGQWANEARPGLIFMDIEMPVKNGLDTLKAIKSNENFRKIPVVMMTGVSDETHMRKAAEYGANSYTLKPANAEQFLQTVMASTSYWLAVHQYPERRLPQDQCRR